MADEKFLSGALASVGYARLKSHVYVATWSTAEVEHFIYATPLRGSPGLVTFHFGFRNPNAEEFSKRAIVRYGGDIYQLLEHNSRTDCFIRFPLERLKPATPRWSFNVSDAHDATIAAVMRELLIPAIQDIKTCRSLLSVLLSDVEPWPWMATNGGIRAAQVVALASMLGVDARQTREDLNLRDRWIRMAVPSDSVAYVERLIADGARLRPR